jgi:hypothetical protein
LLSARPLQEPQELTHLLLTQAHRLLRFLTSLFLAATLVLLALLAQTALLDQLDLLDLLAPQDHKGRKAFKAILDLQGQLDLRALLRPSLLAQQLQVQQAQTHL